VSKLHPADFIVRMIGTIVDILIWHAADVTTQMLCIGITVCRPLYKDWLYRVVDHIESSVKGSSGDASKELAIKARRAPDNVALRTIGGSEAKPQCDITVSDAQPGSVPSWTLRRDLVFQTDATSSEVASPAPVATTPSDLEKSFWPGRRKHK